MPRVKCGKCQAVIKLDAVPADGSIQCTACGATFRVRTKASESSATTPPATDPRPAPAPLNTDQPDFSFAAAATPPAPKSGGGIDLGFLGGNPPAPAPQPPADSPPETPAEKSPVQTPPVPDAPTPAFDFVSTGTKPKRKPAKRAAAAEPPRETPPPEIPIPETRTPQTPLPQTPLPQTPSPQTPSPQTPSPETPLPETPLPDVSSSPYASPTPAITPADSGGSGMQTGGDLLAMPAPSFMTGMFDGSFKYFLTPRIVKVFWILALVAAGIALTLVLGSYFLMLYGILVADVGLPDGQRYAAEFGYAAEIDSDSAVVMQFQPGPPRRASSFTTVGKLGTALFSTLYTLASVTMILMWLLFLRMILEAFCVLFGIRVSLRTMAERS